MNYISTLLNAVSPEMKYSVTQTSSESDTSSSDSPSREKKHKCKIMGCGKAFRFPSELQRHELMHSNNRPFQCPVKKCQKSFKRLDILKNHMKVHTKETPYSCPQPLCGKRFANRAALTYHLQRQGCQKMMNPNGENFDFPETSSYKDNSEEIFNESTSEGTYECEGLECFSVHAKKEAFETQSYPMVANQNWVLKDRPESLIPVDQKTMTVDLMKIMKENELLKQRLEENFKRISLLTSQFNLQPPQEPMREIDSSHQFFQEVEYRPEEFDFNFNYGFEQ